MNEPKVILKDLPDEINGVLLTDDFHSKIYINSNLNNTQKVCAIAHELIHFYSYRDCNYYKCKKYFEVCNCNWIENKIEKEVAYSLIPEIALESFIIPYLESYSLFELSEEIGVTENLLRLRLEKYNFIARKKIE